jgi:hypothetical protein
MVTPDDYRTEEGAAPDNFISLDHDGEVPLPIDDDSVDSSVDREQFDPDSRTPTLVPPVLAARSPGKPDIPIGRSLVTDPAPKPIRSVDSAIKRALGRERTASSSRPEAMNTYLGPIVPDLSIPRQGSRPSPLDDESVVASGGFQQPVFQRPTKDRSAITAAAHGYDELPPLVPASGEPEVAPDLRFAGNGETSMPPVMLSDDGVVVFVPHKPVVERRASGPASQAQDGAQIKARIITTVSEVPLLTPPRDPPASEPRTERARRTSSARRAHIPRTTVAKQRTNLTWLIVAGGVILIVSGVVTWLILR